MITCVDQHACFKAEVLEAAVLCCDHSQAIQSWLGLSLMDRARLVSGRWVGLVVMAGMRFAVSLSRDNLPHDRLAAHPAGPGLDEAFFALED